ncbi:MAG: acyltransferase family protein [Anaerolineales bacterium]
MDTTDSGRNSAVTQPEAPTDKSTRLHYLDWLQVLAVLGVFLFHAVHPFDDLADWHIKNLEKSVLATFYAGFFNLWGMPFFFLMAGATSWFSLRRRTAGQYARERVQRLLIPFIIGALVLTPIQAYFELIHNGYWQGGSFLEFVLSSEARSYFYTEYHTLTLGPEIFGTIGYHLWFVAFLFAFSLIALPIFIWLKRDSGKRFAASFARLADWRGGLLVFVIPLILIRYILQPYFPAYTGWSDFTIMLAFFIFGFILIADERFKGAIRRDWLLHLILGIACTSFFFSIAAGIPVDKWMYSPGTPMFYISWILHSINAWCWTMFIFYIGMRFLDFSNNVLRYSREASYPFFFIHQPVIIFVAFYVVQWQVGVPIKMVVVILGTFILIVGIYELLVRRVNPIRALLGIKPRKN